MNREIIHRRKRLLNLTNAQLAEKAGITLSNLEKIMSGANPNPSVATLTAISNVIGCTLDDFEKVNPESDVEQRFYVRTDIKLFQAIQKYQSDVNYSDVNAAAQALLWYALDHQAMVETVGDPNYQAPLALDSIHIFVAELLRRGDPKEVDAILAPFYEKYKGLLDRGDNKSNLQNLAKRYQPVSGVQKEEQAE